MKSDSGRFYIYNALSLILLTTIAACSGTKNASESSNKATYKSTTTTKKVVVTPATPVVSANLAPGMERDVLELINDYRKSKKLPPLQSSPAMEYQARMHSMDMATHRIPFGHQGLTFRMKYIAEKVPGVTQVGENVAYGNLSAKAVVTGWLKSPEHKKNIEGVYRYTGIGVTRNMQNQLYFTQIFAK